MASYNQKPCKRVIVTENDQGSYNCKMPQAIKSSFQTLRDQPAILPALALFIIFSIYAPNTVHWRDSGEFIISGYFQDISHPAGYPLYGQLTNLFALIPLGNIAWRISLASVSYALLFIFVSSFLTSFVLKTYFNLDRHIAGWLGILPAAIALSAPVFIKQAITAEVYVLNSVFLEILICLFLLFKKTGDLRWLLIFSFTAGLACGNHITLVLALPAFAFSIVLHFNILKRLILPGLISFAFGLSIFLYIPARSTAKPILNTGNPSTLQRFARLVSDARQFELKPLQTTHINQAKSTKDYVARIFLRMVKDAKELHQHIPYFYYAVALVGLLILAIRSLELAAIISWLALSHWFFFKGWPPDPRMPLIFIIGFLTSIAAALFIQPLAAALSRRTGIVISVTLAALLLLIGINRTWQNCSSGKNEQLPISIARKSLEALPIDSVYLSERSWFINLYAQNIEGLRPDILLIYTPSLVYPKYFYFPEIVDRNNKVIADPLKNYNPNFPLFNLKDFVNRASRIVRLGYEPSPNLNLFFKNVSELNDNGSILLAPRGQRGFVSDKFPVAIENRLLHWQSTYANTWLPLKFEKQHFILSELNAYADLLKAQANIPATIFLYQKTCSNTSFCNITTLNNLAVAYIDAGQYNQSIELLESLLPKSGFDHQALLKNLRIAYDHLKNKRQITE